MRIKRIITTIIALLIVLSFTGCSNDKYKDYRIDLDVPLVDAFVVDIMAYITTDDPENYQLSNPSAEYKEAMQKAVPLFSDIVEGHMTRYRKVQYNATT